MNTKTKLLLNLIHNNRYFYNLNEYLREMVTDKNLSYDNLKYLYKNLYYNKSLFIRQNIFQVCQFIVKGYSQEEAEKLAKILPDAFDKNIFCYNEKEKGYIYNKLFLDLEFVYMQYDYYKNIEDTKNKAYEIVKEDIELTTIEQREIEVKIKQKELNTRKKLEKAYKVINKEMDELRVEFAKNTSTDPKLIEYFKNDEPKDRFTSIMVARAILGGIALRNIWRENDKLSGTLETYPYSEEQIKIVNRYNRLQESLNKLEYYAENIFEDEDEIE